MTLNIAQEKKYADDYAFLRQRVTCLNTVVRFCQRDNLNQQQSNPSGIFWKFALLNATAKKIAATTIPRAFRAFQIRKNTINKENAPPRNKTTSVTQNNRLQELINQEKHILEHHKAAVDASFFGDRHKNCKGNNKGNNKKAHRRKRNEHIQTERTHSEIYKL